MFMRYELVYSKLEGNLIKSIILIIIRLYKNLHNNYNFKIFGILSCSLYHVSLKSSLVIRKPQYNQ
jgi:hypothetical protein